MERPKQRRPSSAESVAIFPEQLRIGDRFTNADGEWEIASRPVTFKQGQEVRARIQRPGDPAADLMVWTRSQKRRSPVVP